MGDKSTSAGEASIKLASPAAVNYKHAHEAVFELSNFTIRIPNSFGFIFMALIIFIYLF